MSRDQELRNICFEQIKKINSELQMIINNERTQILFLVMEDPIPNFLRIVNESMGYQNILESDLNDLDLGVNNRIQRYNNDFMLNIFSQQVPETFNRIEGYKLLKIVFFQKAGINNFGFIHEKITYKQYIPPPQYQNKNYKQNNFDSYFSNQNKNGQQNNFDYDFSNNIQIDGINNFINKYPNLKQVKNKKEVTKEQMEGLIGDQYDAHDILDIADNQTISFHFAEGGKKKAVYLNISCDHKIIQKAIDNEEFDEIQHDCESRILLLKNQMIKEENFQKKEDEYKSSYIGLTEYLQTSYSSQQEILNKYGYVVKKNLAQLNQISNKRLKKDLFELFECLNDSFDFIPDYAKKQNFFVFYTQFDDPNLLNAVLIGPHDTPYAEIPYDLQIKVPEDYPNSPPEVIFKQEILHPNISQSDKNWNCTQTLQTILISIVSLFYEKNLADVYNHYAKILFQNDNYDEIRAQIVKQAILTGAIKLNIKIQKEQVKQVILDDYDYEEENDNDIDKRETGVYDNDYDYDDGQEYYDGGDGGHNDGEEIEEEKEDSD